MPDIGFRVLRVDDSNYEDRRKNVGSYSQADLDFDVDIRKSDRSDLDLLFEASNCHMMSESTLRPAVNSMGIPCTVWMMDGCSRASKRTFPNR